MDRNMAMGRVLAALALAGAAACGAGANGGANSISVGASAVTLKNDGSTVLITAASADAAGAAGAGSVTFSASVGSLGANGDRFVDVPLTADGVASVEFSCNSASDSRCGAGAALVNAKWNNALAHVVVAIVDAGSTGGTTAPTLSVKSTTPSTIQPTGGTTTSSVVTFSLVDSSGAGVSGKTIAVAEAPGESLVTLSVANVATDAAGAASVTITSTAATGVAHLTGTVAGSAPVSFTVTVTPPTPPVLSVKSTTPSTIQPLGGNPTSAVVSFSLVDSSGTGLSGKSVALVEQAGENLVTLSAPAVTTDASGASSVTVSSKGGAGTAHLTATVTGSTPVSFTVSIVAPPPTLAVKTISLPSIFTADGASFALPTTTDVTFSLLDFANAPVAGKSVAIAEQAGETLLTSGAATVTTDATGIATVTLSSGAVSGTAHMTATVDGSTPVSFTVNVTGVPASIHASTGIALLGLRGSGIQEQGAMNFVVTDSFGKAVAGVPVAIAQKAPQLVKLTSNSAVTDASGIAKVSFTAGGEVGVTSLTASVAVTGASASAMVAVRGAKPSASGFYFRCEHASLPVYTTVTGVETMTCTVRLADRFGNRVGIPTAVSFSTEAGTITANAVTKTFDPENPNDPDEGTATVTFSTDMGNGNDPADVDQLVAATQYPWDRLDEPARADGSLVLNPRDQLVTIVAMTRGEEAFEDANHNGILDPDEVFVDQGDPIVDANDNGVYDPGLPVAQRAAGGEFEARFCGLDPDCGVYHGPNGAWDEDTVIWKPTWVVFTGTGAATTMPAGPLPAVPTPDFSFLCAEYSDAAFDASRWLTITAPVYAYDHWLNVPGSGTTISVDSPSTSQIAATGFGFGAPLPESWGAMGSLGFDFDYVRVAAAPPNAGQACDIANGPACVEKLLFRDFSDGNVGVVSVTNGTTIPKAPATPSTTGYGCAPEPGITSATTADQYGSAQFQLPISVHGANQSVAVTNFVGRYARGAGK